MKSSLKRQSDGSCSCVRHFYSQLFYSFFLIGKPTHASIEDWNHDLSLTPFFMEEEMLRFYLIHSCTCSRLCTKQGMHSLGCHHLESCSGCLSLHDTIWHVHHIEKYFFLFLNRHKWLSQALSWSTFLAVEIFGNF